MQNTIRRMLCEIFFLRLAAGHADTFVEPLQSLLLLLEPCRVIAPDQQDGQLLCRTFRCRLERSGEVFLQCLLQKIIFPGIAIGARVPSSSILYQLSPGSFLQI